MPPKSQNTEKTHKRAIDMLDRQLSQLSQPKRINGFPTNGPNTQMRSTSPLRSIQRSPTFQPDETSPTPKRRRVLSTEREHSTNPSGLITSSPPMKLQQNRSQADIQRKEYSASSPIRKSVTFSKPVDIPLLNYDAVQFSPNHSAHIEPQRSILRSANTDAQAQTTPPTNANNGTTNTPPKNLNEENSPYSTDPADINYWAQGEIHQLRKKSDITEFTNILDGGMTVLKLSKERCFEIYSTFLTIFPSNSKIINPKDYKPTSFEKRQLTVISDKLDDLICITVTHLTELHELCGKLPTSKDAFVSRTYVQIIKFLTQILSNNILLQALQRYPDARNMVSSVYKYAIEALQNSLTNKATVVAYVIFLKDEKYGSPYLKNSEISRIVSVLTKIKEFPSSNLNNEKMNLIKSFLNKYPQQMVIAAPVWVPGEAIPRMILHYSSYGWKMRISAISNLLDLLKIFSEFPKYHDAFFQSIEVESVSAVVPQHVLKPLLNSFPGRPNNHITVGSIVRNYIIRLIDDGVLKVANDLWLSMVGLLYNNPKKILKFLDQNNGDNWIEVNRKCFASEKVTAKLISLKVWRMVIYGVYTTILNSQTHNFEFSKLYEILIKPFDMAMSIPNYQDKEEGILYLLNSITFIATIISYKNDIVPNATRNSTWTNILQPIYQQVLNNSNNTSIQNRIMNLTLRIFDLRYLASEKPLTKNESITKLILPRAIKVIASSGIPIDEIVCFQQDVIQDNFQTLSRQIMKLLETIVDMDEARSNLESLIHIVPEVNMTVDLFREFSLCLLRYLTKERSDNPKSNAKEIKFSSISSALIRKFMPILLKEQSSSTLVWYLSLFPNTLPNATFAYMHLMKDSLASESPRIWKYTVFEAFLSLGNNDITEYITNLMSTMLVPRDITYDELRFLLELVHKIPEDAVVYNIIPSLRNYEEKLSPLDYSNMLSILHIENWPQVKSAKFIVQYCKNVKGKIPKCFVDQISTSFKGDDTNFSRLFQILDQLKEPTIMNALLTINEEGKRTKMLLMSPNALKYLNEKDVDVFLNTIDNYNMVIRHNILLQLTKVLPEKIVNCPNIIINQYIRPLSEVNAPIPNDFLEFVLSIFFKHSLVHPVNEILELLISHGYSAQFEAFCRENKFTDMTSKVLAGYLLTVGGARKEKIEMLQWSLFNNPYSYNIVVINELASQVHYSFVRDIMQDMLSFFVNPQVPLSDKEKENAHDDFQNFMNLVVKGSSTGIYWVLNMFKQTLPDIWDKKVVGLVEICIIQIHRIDSEGGTSRNMQKILDFFNTGVINFNTSMASESSSSEFQTPQELIQDPAKVTLNKASTDITEVAETPMQTQISRNPPVTNVGPVVVPTENNIITSSFPEQQPKTNEPAVSQQTDAEGSSGTKLTLPEVNSSNPQELHSSEIRSLKSSEMPSTFTMSQDDIAMGTQAMKSTSILKAHLVNEALKKNIASVEIPVVQDNDNSSGDHEVEVSQQEIHHSYSEAEKISSDAIAVDIETAEPLSSQGAISNDSRTPPTQPPAISVGNNEIIGPPVLSPANEVQTVEDVTPVNVPSESTSDESQSQVSVTKSAITPHPGFSDDFIDVEIDDDDEFLRELEEQQNISVQHTQPTRTEPTLFVVDDDVGDINNSKKENVDNADNMDQMDDFVMNDDDFSSDYVIPGQVAPGDIGQVQNDKNDAATDAGDKSGTEVKGIKIPIFNLKNILQKNKQTGSRTQTFTTQRTPVSTDFGDISLLRNPVAQSLPQPSNLFVEPPDLNLDIYGMADDSENSNLNESPALKSHFPYKKTRKLINRMKSVSSDDLERLSSHEKRNLRIELLDFLMKLERHTENS